jgi:hypothetical protein
MKKRGVFLKIIKELKEVSYEKGNLREIRRTIG